MGRIVALAGAALMAVPAVALGHAERVTQFPPGGGTVPEYRTKGPARVGVRGRQPGRRQEAPRRREAPQRALLKKCR